MAANIHSIPLDHEHHSTSASAAPPPLTTPETIRAWPPPAMTSMPDSAYLNGNRATAFAHQHASCSNLKARPPRFYPCNFCNREFSSAQALGGHMNVHRRDRARLRGASPPRSSYLRDHNAASRPNPQLLSQQADSYQSPLTLSLMDPAVSSDSVSCKITISKTVPFLITTCPFMSPFMSNSSSPAVVYDPSHSARPNGSSTTSASSCPTLSEPAVPAPPPPPQSLPLAASTPLMPLEGQTNTPRNFPPSCPLDDRCSLPSNLSLIHLKSSGSTRKKSIASLGCQPYPSLSFKRMDKSHASSRSDVGKGTIGSLDLELRLGQSSRTAQPTSKI